MSLVLPTSCATYRLVLLVCTGMLICLGAFAGCTTRTFDDADAYAAYVTSESGPFVQVQDHEHVEVQARFAPPDAMAVSALRQVAEASNETHNTTGVSDSVRSVREAELRETARAQRKAFGRSLYFYLTVEPTDGDLVYNALHHQGYDAYSRWLHRLLFGLQSKITLEAGDLNDIPLSVYRMDRSYGMARHRTFLLAFPGTFNDVDLRAGSVQLVVEEFGLRTGRLTFDFNVEALQDAARLDLGLDAP
jgi:hypothetical protein